LEDDLNRLIDVDVDGVHLVGAPANRRPFAIIKGLARPGDPDLEESGPVKITDLLKAVGLKPEGALEKVETEMTSEQMKALLEALGKDNGEKLIEAIGKEKVAKILGVESPKADPKIDKSGLTDEVKAYVEKLEAGQKELKTTLDAIVNDRDEVEKAELEKRVEALKDAGFEAPEKATSVQVDALELALGKYHELQKTLGIFELKGTDRDGVSSAADAVRKQVREQLGREPKDAVEEAQVRREIYRSNPGLLRAITKEERQARAG